MKRGEWKEDEGEPSARGAGRERGRFSVEETKTDVYVRVLCEVVVRGKSEAAATG
jgi:hypothetical protein